MKWPWFMQQTTHKENIKPLKHTSSYYVLQSTEEKVSTKTVQEKTTINYYTAKLQ